MKENKTKFIFIASLAISLVAFLSVLLFDASGSTKNNHENRSLSSADRIEILRKASQGDPSVKETLLQWSRSNNLNDKERSALHLWRYNDEVALKALASLSRDKNPSVRAQAYDSLSLSKNNKALSILDSALKNPKMPQTEKALISLLKSRGVKSKELDKHINIILEALNSQERSIQELLIRPTLSALVEVPQGREKLKAHVEKQKATSLTKENAYQLILAASYSCSSNRYDIFKIGLQTLKDAHEKVQIKALLELRKHGGKGAEILALYTGSGSKLPDSFKKAMQKQITENKFANVCERIQK